MAINPSSRAAPRGSLRMRRALALLGFALAATPSLAATVGASSVSPAFGNTIVSTYPDGRTAELWLAPDGSYKGLGRKRNDASAGHWKLKGDKLCLKQSRPLPVPFSYCFPLPAGGFEKPWPGKAPTGEATTIKLVRGHIAGG